MLSMRLLFRFLYME